MRCDYVCLDLFAVMLQQYFAEHMLQTYPIGGHGQSEDIRNLGQGVVPAAERGPSFDVRLPDLDRLSRDSR